MCVKKISYLSLYLLICPHIVTGTSFLTVGGYGQTHRGLRTVSFGLPSRCVSSGTSSDNDEDGVPHSVSDSESESESENDSD